MNRRRVASWCSNRMLILVFGLVFSAFASSPAVAAQNHEYRWDLVSIDFTTTPITISAGGIDSAKANDGSQITLTGSGTFRSNPGKPQDVTGGGMWETFDKFGVETGSGKYEVTGFVSFVLAPGIQGPAIDTIGNIADGRAGLAVLQIGYSDGSDGVLVVSCHIPGGPPFAPASVFEGITASKDFVDYWNRLAPSPGVDANRTLFHVLR